MNLTPEQEALKQAAYSYHTNPNPGTAFDFRRAVNPAAILTLLAQLEAAQEARAPFAYVTADRKMLIFADNVEGITDDIASLSPLYLGVP